MRNHMHPMLLGLDRSALSSQELLIIENFENDPESRVFLAVSDILKSYGYQHQALELLLQGVESHSYFTAARVHLAQELFKQGLFRHCWQIFEQSPSALDQNPVACKLQWKLSILLKFNQLAIDFSYDLKKKKFLFESELEWCELIISGFVDQVRFSLRKSLTDKDIPLDDLNSIAVESTSPSSYSATRWGGFQKCSVRDVLNSPIGLNKNDFDKKKIENDDWGGSLLSQIGILSPKEKKYPTPKSSSKKEQYYKSLLRVLGS